MNNAHERHPSPVGMFEILVEHRFNFRSAISAKIELEVYRSTRRRHDDRPRRLLVTCSAKVLERANWLPGLECAKHYIGHSSFDGDDLALLVERQDSHQIPHQYRFPSRHWRR